MIIVASDHAPVVLGLWFKCLVSTHALWCLKTYLLSDENFVEPISELILSLIINKSGEFDVYAMGNTEGIYQKANKLL